MREERKTTTVAPATCNCDTSRNKLLYLSKEHVLAGDMALLDSDGMENVLKCAALTCNVLMDFSDLRILLTERVAGGAQL